MIKLVVALAFAAMLWPLDENNRPLQLSNSGIDIGDLAHAGYTVAIDAASFCDRNQASCETVSVLFQGMVSSMAARIGTSVAPNPSAATDQAQSPAS